MIEEYWEMCWTCDGGGILPDDRYEFVYCPTCEGIGGWWVNLKIVRSAGAKPKKSPPDSEEE